MKLAIMQPYFFHYIGYFQLIGAVKTFLISNEVICKPNSLKNISYGEQVGIRGINNRNGYFNFELGEKNDR